VVNGHEIRKDSNGAWFAKPPVTDTQMQKAINNFILSLENGTSDHTRPQLQRPSERKSDQST